MWEYVAVGAGAWWLLDLPLFWICLCSAIGIVGELLLQAWQEHRRSVAADEQHVQLFSAPLLHRDTRPRRVDGQWRVP